MSEQVTFNERLMSDLN